MAAVLFTLALAGCSSSEPPETTPPVAPAPTPTGVNPEPTTWPTRPTSEPEQLELARDRAVDALTLFLRPDTSQDEWLTALTPYLEEGAYAAYATVQPNRIPDHVVQPDGATVLEGATTYTAIVAVPTSGGTWNVSLTRTGPEATWFITRFEQP